MIWLIGLGIVVAALLVFVAAIIWLIREAIASSVGGGLNW